MSSWNELDREAIAMFKFTYRSKEGLQQEGIIPRTPSPKLIMKPEHPSVDDLAPEEVRQLAEERLVELRVRRCPTYH